MKLLYQKYRPHGAIKPIEINFIINNANKIILEENFSSKLSNKRRNKSIYLSLTLEQGSNISSFAAILATQPSTTWLRYTNGVLPINCIF